MCMYSTEDLHTCFKGPWTRSYDKTSCRAIRYIQKISNTEILCIFLPIKLAFQETKALIWSVLDSHGKSNFKLAKILEYKIATHSSIFAWKIPWTEELGGLQYMGSQRVGHDRAPKQQQALCLDHGWWGESGNFPSCTNLVLE